MAIGWLTVLKNVPWTEVIGNAPKVADGARKLWNTVGKRGAVSESAAASTPPDAGPQAQSLAELRSRLAALEQAAAGFHEQMLASSELIKALAEQNAQLIKGIEVNRTRVAWLALALAIIAITAAGALALTLMR